MKSLNIAFITPEAVPYAKTGGLADVSGSLPAALAARGHKVRLFMPKYRSVSAFLAESNRPDISFNCLVGDKEVPAEIYSLTDKESGVEIYFIGNDFFFDREALYVDPTTGKDYPDNDERFIFFGRAVLELVKILDWKPDIFHANDWQSGLVPALLKTAYYEDPFFAKSRTVFTIHNMGYQGQFPEDTFDKLNIAESNFYAAGPFEYWGDINFMKAGIALADKVTTVSATYAQEIQLNDDFGKGLQGVLAERSADLVGILNGVDYNQWSPQKDKLIPHRYFPANLSGKKKNKLELLNRCGFPLRSEQPLIGVISRLDRQKGFDLLKEIMGDIMALDLQLVLLGTGDEEYHRFFAEIEKEYPDKCRAFLTFDNKLAHLIEAGSDIFLMPSRYEPCGLNQMYSMKYGTIPIVRRTGGLADSVINFNEEALTGTGFVFDDYKSAELLETIKKAVQTFSRRKVWFKIIKRAMAQDFSWARSAIKYEELYFQTLQ
ncbi:MAG: glycogen synthase GlgA [candidate division Zixibacteria bacterium HGW-Zixibacteria-1]|nr:MAG: glycogen synthase GlgA [candidate division Zixibacteria bacterium HGW-Zixibacteria-1]